MSFPEFGAKLVAAHQPFTSYKIKAAACLYIVHAALTLSPPSPIHLFLYVCITPGLNRSTSALFAASMPMETTCRVSSGSMMASTQRRAAA